MKLHACTNVKKDGIYTGYFLCNACSFAGILDEAIKHVVENQYDVKTPKVKKSFIKAHPETKSYYKMDSY